MIKIIKKLTYIFIPVMLITSFLSIAPRASAYDQNNLASDSVFNNTSSMSVSDINDLLNRYSGSCISTNNSFTTADPQGYSGSSYQFGGNVSGGQAIYDIAQNYHVNPQVILATMQKEQSIPTGSAGCHTDKPNPSDSSQIYTCTIGSKTGNCTDACPYSGGCMNIAMSYDCPGSCWAAIEGFSNQISGGTWVLRWAQERAYGTLTGYAGYDSGDEYYCYGGPMTAGYRQRSASSHTCNGAPGNQSIYYDGTWTTTVGGGTSVTIDNGATASLYEYTPSISGGQSFDNIFTSTFGFGDPATGALTIPHRDGTLVKPANSNKVYLLKNIGNWPNEDIEAQYIPSAAVFASWGFNFKDVEIANQGDLSLMAATDADTSHTSHPAPLQLRQGTLIKGSGPDIYVVQNSTNNVKDHITSWDAFTHMGYSLNDVIAVADSDLSTIPTDSDSDITASKTTHPTGTLVKDANSPTVYLIGNGIKQPIATASIFASQGFSWSSVRPALAGDDSLPTSSALTDFRAGTLLKGSGPNVYIINTWPNFGQGKLLFSYYTFVGFDYHFSNVMTAPDSEVSGVTDGGPVPSY